MKKLNFLSLVFAGLLIFVSLTTIKAQDETPPDAPNQNADNSPRTNLIEQLGLTQDQIKQVRQVNQERKPQLREAQERLREANRNLDKAIYADTADEAEIQTRLKEVQSAHSEIVKIRSQTELAVRKILTPAQLAKFRDVRQQFMDGNENRQQRIKNRRTNAPNRLLNNRRMNAPNRHLNNRQRPPRRN